MDFFRGEAERKQLAANMSRLAAWQWLPAASLHTVHPQALRTEPPQIYCSARFATQVSQLNVSLCECLKPCRRSSAMQFFLRSASTYAFRHSPVRLGLRGGQLSLATSA